MTPLEVLVELVDRLGGCGGTAVLISEAEFGRWLGEAVHALKSQRIITKAKAADSAVCPGCEEECVMPVVTLPSGEGAVRSFILCEQRDDTNRVPVATDQLLQWRCSLELVCGFVADCLGLHRVRWQRNQAGMVEIGMVTGNKQVQMVCIEVTDRVQVVAGQNKVDLADLVAFDNGKFSVHQGMIKRLVDSSNMADKRYTPSVVRREASKLETKAVHDSWKAQYKILAKKHPDMPDAWIAGKIKKMPVGKKYSVETIRKNMK
jgi:hypothetical protein